MEDAIRTLFVGVSDAKVSREAGTSLVTYALASCIGISIYDPVTAVGGLLHYMLPDSRIDLVKAKEHPWMFADTAIPMFFQQAYRLGAEKSRLRVIAAGGAQVLQSQDSLEIGKRNQLAMRRIFWKSGVLLEAEDMGGSDIRTLRLEIGTGRLMVRKNGVEERELRSDRDMWKTRGSHYASL
jgi:chemotaxis protein CheD